MQINSKTKIMLNWEITNPEAVETVELYNDENEEQDFDCSKQLLVKYHDDCSGKETFTKGYFVHDKNEWFDTEGFQLFQVSGWYDLEKELNIEQ